MRPVRKAKPPRLARVFAGETAPLYLVTFNTLLRRPLLARAEVHAAFREFAERATAQRVAVGRYVLLPDHAHLFVRVAGELALGTWMRLLKQKLGQTLAAAGFEPAQVPGQRLRSYWQPGFFDHLLRRDESYAQKWQYVWLNPVRAGLAAAPEAWPWQGEIVRIDRA